MEPDLSCHVAESRVIELIWQNFDYNRPRLHEAAVADMGSMGRDKDRCPLQLLDLLVERQLMQLIGLDDHSRAFVFQGSYNGGLIQDPPSPSISQIVSHLMSELVRYLAIQSHDS